MGLLKLGSIYKKKSKKETHVPALPSKPEPLSLELNLNLNNSSIDTPVTSPQSNHINQNNNNNTVPAGSGSLFDDIFAELGTKPAAKSQEEKGYSVMDNDFSLALALSQQLELDQDNMKGMTGTTKIGNNMFNKSEKKVNHDNNTAAFLLGDDSIYSNYLKGLSALDNNNNDTHTSSSLSTSMFDSILNKTSPNNASGFTTTTTTYMTSPISPTSPSTIPSNHITQVVLDSDISDSDDSKLSDDSDDENNNNNNGRHGKSQRMTKGVQPIMERRDNRRKIDNWSNRIEAAELNESMIERMKDRHRTQVKMAALRNQQQLQDEFNMMGYTQQQQQHMVPQQYVPPAMMPISPTTGVLQHPGLLMDPVQMYYPNSQLLPVNNDLPDNPHTSKPLKQVTQVPAGFLPNPTHATLAIPHPPKEDDVITDERQQQKPLPQRKSYFGPLPPPQQQQQMMLQPNHHNRIGGSTSNISARLSTPPSSASSTTGKHNSSTSTLERIDDDEEEENVLAESPVPMDTPSPVLEEQRMLHDELAAEEADAESSAEETTPVITSSPRRKKSIKKLRQSQSEVSVKENNVESQSDLTVRPSRSTPNMKKGKKKSSSRSSSRRNSQDLTNSETTLPTPPPLPQNSPYMNYNPEENLYHVPRSSSQHQLHHYQQQLQQQHRQSLRHMKSEPELPRRSNSSNTQQKMYQQQQQLNMEWERMQNYQREQMLKQQQGFVPMYPMYYSSNQKMMMDPSLYPKHPQHYDPYQGPAYNMNSSHSKNKVPPYYQSSR